MYISQDLYLCRTPSPHMDHLSACSIFFEMAEIVVMSFNCIKIHSGEVVDRYLSVA